MAVYYFYLQAAMEQQRNMVQDQAILIQDRHASMLKQQQMQSETLLKQIQSQMESEMRMKNDLVRNQLSVLAELQMQNPTDTIDINGIMEKLQKR